MKVELDLVNFGHLDKGREYCLACGSAPQGELVPGPLVYYALRHRVCDSCANRGEGYIRKAIEKHAERLRQQAAAFERRLRRASRSRRSRGRSGRRWSSGPNAR